VRSTLTQPALRAPPDALVKSCERAGAVGTRALSA
jgi:hypothetical protein